MTEDEAKTKWCPFSRVVGAETNGKGDMKIMDAPAHNRVSIRGSGGAAQIHSASLCIASACMAFRQSGWRDKEDGEIKGMAYTKADKEHWEPMFYCGLAGRP